MTVFYDPSKHGKSVIVPGAANRGLYNYSLLGFIVSFVGLMTAFSPTHSGRLCEWLMGTDRQIAWLMRGAWGLAAGAGVSFGRTFVLGRASQSTWLRAQSDCLPRDWREQIAAANYPLLTPSAGKADRLTSVGLAMVPGVVQCWLVCVSVVVDCEC